MTLLLAGILAVGMGLPHVLRLRRAAPLAAAALWGASLALRALTAVFTVIYLVLFLPGTALFGALTHWCWHTVLPLAAAHLGLEGHRVGDAATVLPGFLVAASVVSVGVGVFRAARSVRRLIERHALGAGPGDSVIVGGPDVVMAAAGLRRPRVLVSAGALTKLDDDELNAGLDHERGHIARRHRFVQLFAQLCHAVGRFIPGSRRALTELAFHLERDADLWALRRANDPYALASAICKAAGATPRRAFGAMSLANSGVIERLDQLVGDEPLTASGPRTSVLNGLAIAMVAVVLGGVALLPATAGAGVRQLGVDAPVRHCER
jgi:Zn-dependent protease with chaperone function